MEPLNRSLSDQFPNHWQASTADSNLTLHGFRRFKTSHLLNLRYLEAEIAEIDHLIYQIGLGLDIEPSKVDRLGLKQCQKDEKAPRPEKAVSKKLIQRLRRLMKEYDEAIIAFSTIMSMDTFSLIEDEQQSTLADRPLYEMYKTRLIRIDQRPRTRQDPLQRYIHRIMRFFRYIRVLKASHQNSVESASQNVHSRKRDGWSSQNTALIADATSRVIVALTTAVFLTIPLVVLSHEPRPSIQMIIIAVCVVAFACFVSFALRASNLEMMVVAAGYAAIIAVFISNGSGGSKQTT
ncbi:hypothetical protein XA68_17097 [Ophiocordyceps unilateralis]|uniref:DUF6594 domain-containing protein n=1 Tax=Ophiocordyceps unilateralis TaxID=268505 RepID=A0A2A9PKW6_OPHUN|nr:hypothetical protein XA68_17097 [Ophiocordyceps unilateralis]